MSVLEKAYDALVRLLAVLAGVCIVVITVSVIYDVLVRSTGVSPPAITSALVEYLLLYFTLFAAPYLVRKRAHVVIDAFVARIPPTLRWFAEKLTYSVSIIITLAFAWISFQLLLDSIDSGRFDERSIDIPMWLLYAPMPIGFLFVAAEFARCLLGRGSIYQDLTEVKDSV